MISRPLLKDGLRGSKIFLRNIVGNMNQRSHSSRNFFQFNHIRCIMVFSQQSGLKVDKQIDCNYRKEKYSTTHINYDSVGAIDYEQVKSQILSSNCEDYCSLITSMANNKLEKEALMKLKPCIETRLITLSADRAFDIRTLELILRGLGHAGIKWTDLSDTCRSSIIRECSMLVMPTSEESLKLLEGLCGLYISAKTIQKGDNDSLCKVISTLICNLDDNLNNNEEVSKLLSTLVMMGFSFRSLGSPAAMSKVLKIVESAALSADCKFRLKLLIDLKNLEVNWLNLSPKFKEMISESILKVPYNEFSTTNILLDIMGTLGHMECRMADLSDETQTLLYDRLPLRISFEGFYTARAISILLHSLLIMTYEESMSISFERVIAHLKGKKSQAFVGSKFANEISRTFSIGLLCWTRFFRFGIEKYPIDKSQATKISMVRSFVYLFPYGPKFLNLKNVKNYLPDLKLAIQHSEASYSTNYFQSLLVKELKKVEGFEILPECLLPGLEFYPVDIAVKKGGLYKLFIELDGSHHYVFGLGKQELLRKFKLRDFILRSYYPNVPILRIPASNTKHLETIKERIIAQINSK